MKLAKRFLVVLLSLCMLCSAVLPVFAEETAMTEISEEAVADAPETEETDATEAVEEAVSTDESAVQEIPAENVSSEESSTEETVEEAVDETESVDSVEKTAEILGASDSGTWYNLKWSLSGSTLTISGSGAMSQTSQSSYPWYSYRGTVTKIVIGDYVTSISYDAFEDFSNLTSVTLGSRLTKLEYGAFYQCSNLTSVKIPVSVTEIGNYAFYECSNLNIVTFASGSKLVTIGESAFYKCKNLKILELPDALTTIGTSAFRYCSNLLSVTFGSKLKTISNRAFSDCTQLIDADFPDSLRTIGDYAFYNCSSLVSVQIQYGLQSIGYRAFHSCSSLTGNVKIPGTVTSLSADIFHSCTSLQSAQIYAACAIPNYAFKGCTSLSSVTIGNTVTGIGEYAFYEDKSLTKINIPGSVSYIKYSAFRNCSALASVTFASGLASIGDYGFYSTALTSVKLPNSVTSLGYRVFAECYSLQTANVGSGLTAIPTDCFNNCSNLSSVTLGNNINSIGNYAFNNTVLTSINWPTNLNSIGEYAFNNVDTLTSVTLPESLNTIGYSAFRNCDSLASVILESNVTSVGNYAFAYCPSLSVFKTFSTNSTYGSYTFTGSSSVTIYAWADSSAETYANNKNISFVPITSLDTPVNKKITNTVSGVHVYWSYVPGASYYTVYRSTSANGTYSVIKSVCAAIHYTDTSVESGQTYYYKVVAKNGAASSSKSAAQSITYIGTPDITSRINKAAGIQLGWDKITGATGYAIYRKPYSGTGSDTWVRVATITSGSTVSWTDTSVKNNNGTVYKYTIRALSGSTLSGCRNTGRTMARLSSRTLNSAVKASSTSIKCSWSTSSAVTGYEVRFMVGDTVYKTVTIGNYNTGTKIFTGLASGKTYKIQVRAYKKVSGVGSFYSAWSTAKTVTL